MMDVAMEGGEDFQKSMANSMNAVLNSTFFKPLPRTIFDISEPEKAFR